MGARERYGQYCGMSRGAEIFATPWTPIIIRNLLLGCRTFTEILDGAPGLSRTLLAQRLRTLRRYGVVEPAIRGYRLTEAGQALAPVVDALGRWGERWIELAPEHLDAGIVLWGLSRVVPADLLPDRRVVLRFEVPDDGRRRFWLLADDEHVEMCSRSPGPADDLVLTASSQALTRWHTGRVSLRHAVRDGLISVDGPRRLVRMLDSWGGLGGYPDADVSVVRKPVTASVNSSGRSTQGR